MALLETLTDVFPGSTLDTTKWTTALTNAGTATVGSGTLTLFAASNGAASSAVAKSATTYTVNDSQVIAKVDGATYAAEHTARLALTTAGNAEAFSISVSGTTANSFTFAGTNSSGVSILNSSFISAKELHAWWRIRHANGVVYWETAPDGTTWTIQYQRTYTPAYAKTLELSATNSTGQFGGLWSVFDNINTVPPLFETLKEAFDGATLDPAKWTATTSGATIGVAGGTLNISIFGGAVPSGSVTSVGAFTFNGSSFHARVIPDPSNLSGSTFLIADAASTSEYFDMYQSSGTLYLRGYSTTGSTLKDTFITYDATAHAWWRIRHTGTVVYWETSADGFTWTIRAQATYTPARGPYTAQLGYSMNPGSFATVRFDNVNIVPMALLQDGFNGATLDAAKWSTTGTSGSTVAVANGTVNINTAAGLTNPIGSVRSTNGYNFTDASVHAQVWPDATAAGQQTHLRVVPVTGSEAFYFNKLGANLTIAGCDTTGAVFTTATLTYDTTAHVWWKIRNTAGVIYWETSPDGITWTVRLQAPYVLQQEPYRTRLYTQWTGTSTAGTVRYDTVNLTPIAGLQDDFGTGTLDVGKWAPGVYPVNAGSVSVSGGTLRLSTNNGRPSYTTTDARSTGAFSFTDSAAHAQMTHGTYDAKHRVWLRVAATVGSESFDIYRLGVTLNFEGNNPGGGRFYLNSITYDATAHAWWRVRHAGANVHWETSPDGSTWTTRSTTAYVPQSEPYCLRLYTDWVTGGANTVSAVALFDNINVIPYGATVAPGGATDPEILAQPSVTAPPAQPNSIAELETLDGPDVGFNPNLYPEYIQDVETLGDPELYGGDFHRPATLNDAETLDGPELNLHPDPGHPDTLTDAETLDGPDLDIELTRTPDTFEDPETFGQPTLPAIFSGHPGSAADPEQFDTIYVGFQANILFPDTITDPQTLDPSALRFNPSRVDPASIANPQAVGTPAASFVAVYNGNYGTGDYGVGPYQGLFFSPHGITDPQDLAQPDIFTLPPTDPNTILVIGITEAETLDGPLLPRIGANNILYGQGTYGQGPYSGDTTTPTDTNPSDNVIYSYGTYGYGIYYGQAVPVPPANNIPQYRDIAGRTKPPLHILGVGPWSPLAEWRGAKNYGINPGRHPSRPAMALPPATGKGFVLRLNDGGEANCDLAFPRGSAIILDEMDTDLWWRRKDPRTGILEMIGRFNVAHLSVATNDTGVTCSVQFVDYSTVLGERMILEYLNPTHVPPTTMWDINTSVNDIIEWAIPGNTRLDLTELNTYDLGKTIQAFHLPPGTLVSDFLDNLEAVSPAAWEWWIETPNDIDKAPKLRFILGERGSDKGVVLFDHGTGPTPIASWTRNSAADDYANTIYYTGGGSGTGADSGGGVVEEIPAQIKQYGQRDVQDGNTSLGGDIETMRRRATRKLEKYADRRPAYTIRLKQGFWRGLSHINIGDTVTLILRLGEELLLDKYRVSEISVDIDDNNNEDVTLNLGRLPTSADPRSKRAPLTRIVRYLKNYSPPPGAMDVVRPDDDPI